MHELVLSLLGYGQVFYMVEIFSKEIYYGNTNWIPSLLGLKLVSSHHIDVSPYEASLINWTTHSWDLSSISMLLTLSQQVAMQAIPLVSVQTSDKLLRPLVKSAGLAVLAHDVTGSLVAGEIDVVLTPFPLYAEALASLLSVQLALSLQASHFLLEADSLHFVNLLNNSTLSTDCRLANQAVDHLTCLVRRKCPIDWAHQPPSSFSHILLYDAGPTPT
ncbi:hypothetical protein M0R45_035920 [Rubus argutus]|uniref:RNase H type-1 domain-containing protein n=1 Tax=Rubus argutus TaxID=59490 RepID=A0AAW1VW20_RUBAR